MHNSISKKLLAGALSVMMVLSLVAPSGAQAASSYSFKQKSGLSKLTADKAYTYYVKGVKSTQYVKVARTYKDVLVKKGDTVVKKTTKVKGTGKTITLKVTAPDKVANYKNTLKVKVYNKKTNKLVKTLKRTATIKVKKLKVTSVESASTSGKYLIAKFSKKLDSLKVADVTIRQKDTQELLGVEAVNLSSDGKSATIALVGDEKANNFVNNNVTYTFSVTKNSVTASTDFSIDGVYAEYPVVGSDVSKKQITIETTEYDAQAQAWNSVPVQITIPSSITVDYQEVLGRTISVWYNANYEATKVVLAKENVIDGAFKVVVDSDKQVAYLENVATGDKYYTQNLTRGSLYATELVEILKDTQDNKDYCYNDGATDGATFASARLVLNANKTIRTITALRNTTGSIMVGEVKTNSVIGTDKATEVNFKDYTITKDGKTIALNDLKEKDVVFYNATYKYAFVYNNVVTGKLTAAYDKQFKFNDKLYNYTAQYAKEKVGFKDADKDYMTALIKGGKDVTIYFAKTGNAAYVEGETGEVVTETETKNYVLKGDAKAYKSALDGYVKLSLSDGENDSTQNIDLDSLKSITYNNGTKNYTYTIGELEPIADYSKAAAGDKVYVKEFAVEYTSESDITVTANLAKKAGSAWGAAAGTVPLIDTNAASNKDLVDKDLITITTEKKTGTIVGLGVASGAKPTADINAGSKVVTTNTAAVLTGTLQLAGTTPVYFIGATKVTKTTYEKLTGVLDDAKTTVYANASHADVVAIVVDGAEDDAANYITKEMVVSTVATNDGKLADVTGFIGTEEVKGLAIKDDVACSAAIKAGSVVTLKLTADGKTIVSIALATATDAKLLDATSVKTGDKTFTHAGNGYELASTVTPTIVKVVDEGKASAHVELMSFADLQTLTVKDAVVVSMLDASTTYVDTIVVYPEGTNTAATVYANYTAAKTLIETAANEVKVANCGFVCTATANTFDSQKTACIAAVKAINTNALADCTVTVAMKAGETFSSALNATNNIVVTVSKDGYSKVYNLAVVNPAAYN